MNEQMLAAEVFERLDRMVATDSDDFATIAAILGLDPRTDFVEADLAGLKLTGQKFQGCDFTGTDFSGSDFDGSQLEDCRLDGACLADASLGYMTLSGCSFRNADLSNAVFQGAVLTECDFTGANLTGVFFPKTTLKSCTFTDAVLTGANFQAAALVDVDMTGAALEGVTFEECSLEEIDVTPIEELTVEQVRQQFADGLSDAGRRGDEGALLHCLSLLTVQPKAFDDWLGAALRLARLAHRTRNSLVVEAVMERAAGHVAKVGAAAEVAGWLRLSKVWRSFKEPRMAADALQRAADRAESLRLSLPMARLVDVVDEAIRVKFLLGTAETLLDTVRDRLGEATFSRVNASVALRAAEGYLALGDAPSAQRMARRWSTSQHIVEMENSSAWLPVFYRGVALHRRLLALEGGPEDLGAALRLIEYAVEGGSLPWRARLSQRLRLAAECLRSARREHALDVLAHARQDLHRWAADWLGDDFANSLLDLCADRSVLTADFLDTLSKQIRRPTAKRLAQIENAARR